MSVFSANVVTATLASSPAPSDSGTPGIGSGAANPKNIHSNNFLSGGGLQAAVEQAILHGNGTAVVPNLNEYVTGNANQKVTGNRLERVKGATSSKFHGGLLGTYGKSTPASGTPFSSFVYSSVYEGPVRSFWFEAQRQFTYGISDSIEFGDRTVTRTSSEVRTIHGAQASYTYGDIYSRFNGAGKKSLVIDGTKHTRFGEVFSLESVEGLNLLWGIGLHLQTRPGAELNYNLVSMLVALSESLVGVVNAEAILCGITGQTAKYGLSGLRLAADGANIRFCGIPVGPMRIP
jgi:hypothetical protein